MKQTFTHYRADSTCPFTLNGVHLTSLRRAVLGPIASTMGIDPALPKNLIIEGMIKHLVAIESEPEISDLIKPKKKAKKKTK